MINWVKKLFKSILIIDVYIIREILNPFLLAVGGFAIIGMVDIMFVLVGSAVASGISFLIVLRLLLYKLPAVMILFFPMASLFSIMLLFVRMAKDNELGVLRTSGVPTFGIIQPAMLMVFFISFFSF